MPERDIQQQGALVAARFVANMIGLIARQKRRSLPNDTALEAERRLRESVATA
jgi:hypothetical protein